MAKDGICDDNDETIVTKEVERVEEIIMEGIVSIRKSYRRPSYHTLLSLVNEGGEIN